MSKYQQRGAYHFAEFSDARTDYAKHVDDLLVRLAEFIGDGYGKSVFEVGCGEGLILNQIALRLGWKCMGSEIDVAAINMARRMCPHAVIEYSTFPSSVIVDVALFADSLEHVKDPLGMIEWAKRAKWIVTAIPSQHDRHAETQLAGAPDVFDKTLSEWGTMEHRATRHARHLTLWRRHA
jgi:2-polyprenyl-3-methyl-5-hydroxy-6-metoxy-1,4-benzoquinol methylase